MAKPRRRTKEEMLADALADVERLQAEIKAAAAAEQEADERRFARAAQQITNIRKRIAEDEARLAKLIEEFPELAV